MAPQITPGNGLVRAAERRRMRRVAAVLDELPSPQRAAIFAGSPAAGLALIPAQASAPQTETAPYPR